MAFVNSLNLLTCKPVIFAANVGEEDLADDGASNPHVAAVRKYACLLYTSHRRTGGRKDGKWYALPMLAKKVFSSLITTTKLPRCV